jgi:hypothetical protein
VAKSALRSWASRYLVQWGKEHAQGFNESATLEKLTNPSPSCHPMDASIL